MWCDWKSTSTHDKFIYSFSPVTIMTVKKPIKKEEELPTDEELAFDLDLTTNDELHETIFEKLKKKIQSNNEKYVKKTSRNNLLNFK